MRVSHGNNRRCCLPDAVSSSCLRVTYCMGCVKEALLGVLGPESSCRLSYHLRHVSGGWIL